MRFDIAEPSPVLELCNWKSSARRCGGKGPIGGHIFCSVKAEEQSDCRFFESTYLAKAKNLSESSLVRIHLERVADSPRIGGYEGTSENAVVLRHEAHHRIAALAQLGQEVRQHVDRALVDVVEEDNAATSGLEAREGACSDDCGPVLVVILAVDGDIENHKAALAQVGAQEAVLREVGEAEERRRHLPTPRQSESHGTFALGDLVQRFLTAELSQINMGEGVAADGVAARCHLLRQLWLGLSGGAQHQETGPDAEVVEGREDLVGLARARAIVKGQHDFAGREHDIGR